MRTRSPGEKRRQRGRKASLPAKAPVAPPLLAAPGRRAAYSTHDVLALQRLAGNRAVSELLGFPSRSRTGLPPPVETKMEDAFGADFSDVRVNKDSSAAGALGLEAYTEGSDIHLAPGQYQPGTERGQALIGHELAHVVQQRQGRVTATMQARGRLANDDRALEQEAEGAGARAARGEAAGIGTGGSAPGPAARRGRRVMQGSGIETLKAKDPDPDSTAPLQDWPTLRAAAANPRAVDVHQILLTAEKLSHGWQSGLGEVQQALANQYAANEGVPNSEVAFGAPIASPDIIVKPRRKKLVDEGVSVKGLSGTARMKGRAAGYKRNPLTEGTKKLVKPEKRRFFRGTWAEAALLTPKGDPGSDATTGQYADYASSVEGHLLNAHLHGPAETKNLAPFRGSLNKKHSALVEEPLKKMIYNQGRYFHYRVDVTDGTKDKFFPDSITCKVEEVDAAKQPVVGGYKQQIVILQDGNIASHALEFTQAPPGGTMSFTARGGAGAASQGLAWLWNQLRFPWTAEYGAVMKDVLDTAYRAMRNYEGAAGAVGGTAALALPQSVVTFTTANLVNSWDEVEMTGQHMVANPLTLRSPATGEVGSEPAGAAWGLGAIKGHLLNHHLHGPAEPRNLAPMSASLNQVFERTIESVAKRMVLTEGRVVRYEVTMDGADAQFGFDDAPTALTYQLQEYQRLPGFGLDYENIANWALAGPVLTGTLPNGTDDAY